MSRTAIFVVLASMQLAVSAQAQEYCSDPAFKTVKAASAAFNSCMTSHGVHLGDPGSPSAAAACPEEMKRFELATTACRPKLCANNPKYEAAATEKFKAEMGCATREGTRLAHGSGSESEVAAKAFAACEPVLFTAAEFFTAHCSLAHGGSAAEGWVWGQGMVVRAVALGAVRRARAAQAQGPG